MILWIKVVIVFVSFAVINNVSLLLPTANAFLSSSLPTSKLYTVSLSSSSSKSVSAFVRNDHKLFLIRYAYDVQSTVSLPATTVAATTTIDTALSTQDILIGIVLAFTIAFVASYLQGQSTSSFPNYILWRDEKQYFEKKKEEEEEGDDDDNKKRDFSNTEMEVINKNNNSTTTTTTTTTTKILFNESNWNEIKRRENYIWYSNPTLLQQQQRRRRRTQKTQKKKTSKNTITIMFGLAIIFIPIFIIELWLALSRQFLCSSSIEQPIMVQTRTSSSAATTTILMKNSNYNNNDDDKERRLLPSTLPSSSSSSSSWSKGLCLPYYDDGKR